MSTLYVDNLQPNLESRVSIPGHVVQVVSATISTQGQSSANEWVDINLDVSITPSSSSNKVLVTGVIPLRNGGTGDQNVRYTVYRGDTNLGNASYGFGIIKTTDTAVHGSVVISFLDTPSTTSATTYSLYVHPAGVTAQWCGGGSIATLTTQEIAQ
jgi:hypothetical protein